MKKIKPYLFFILFLFLFFLISLFFIYYGAFIDGDSSYFLRQAIWYLIGIIFIFVILKIRIRTLIDYSFYIYLFFTILLILLLLFARPIHGSKCWFTIPYLGTFQPSEFMKIALLLFLTKKMEEFKKKYKNPSVKEEALFLLNVGIITFIPSILTFLEPDTGNVMIYLLMVFIMLFIFGIRIRFFVLLSFIVFFLFFSLLFLYFFHEGLFISIFGSSFFLRIHRLLDWSSKSGYQLEHSLYSIGSAGFLGHGPLGVPLYFPEAQTDFIFAFISSSFGFLGTFLLLSILLLFDLQFVFLFSHTKKPYCFLICGILSLLIIPQIQNIGMTVGLFPITGITLPFISYGGSSILSYFILMGITFSIIKENKYHN